MSDTARVRSIRPENQERSLGSIIAEIKDEMKSFINTRVQMVKTELLEATAALKLALPLAGAAVIIAATAVLLLSLAVVSAVAMAFHGNPYAYFFAFLIVGVAWLVFAAILGFIAYNRVRSHGPFPKRSVQVLKADKVWIQTEAGSNS
jgi:uncharacterized membrane protein YqjE